MCWFDEIKWLNMDPKPDKECVKRDDIFLEVFPWKKKPAKCAYLAPDRLFSTSVGSQKNQIVNPDPYCY